MCATDINDLLYLSIGGALFVSVGQVMFTSVLVAQLVKMVPSVDPAVILSAGADSIKTVVGPAELKGVLSAYNQVSKGLIDRPHVRSSSTYRALRGRSSSRWSWQALRPLPPAWSSGEASRTGTSITPA